VIKKILIFVFTIICLTGGEAWAEEADTSPIFVSDEVDSLVERRIREAAVRVMVADGQGSGSYVKYKDFYFVITAQHVVDSISYKPLYVKKDSEMISAKVVWSNKKYDVAVLAIQKPFETIKPMSWKPASDLPEIGDDLYYSGYPSRHQLLSFKGRVAGFENTGIDNENIIVHSYGWFGCSGSVIYDKEGYIVVVLWGVDVEHYPSLAVVEDIIWVSPVRNIDLEAVAKGACSLKSINKESKRFCK